MSTGPRGTIVRGIDHAQTFRFTAIFSSFRIATQPGKIVMALALVVAMFVVGLLVDGLVGAGRVLPGEFAAFTTGRSAESFAEWRAEQRDRLTGRLSTFLQSQAGLNRAKARELAESDGRWDRAEAALRAAFAERRAVARSRYDTDTEPYRRELADIRQRQLTARSGLAEMQPRGIFHEALRIKIDAFDHLVKAVVDADVGLDQLNPDKPLGGDSIVGAIRMAGYELPRWLWTAHPWFLALWLVVFIGMGSLLGGAISRQAVVEAATGDRISMGEAVHFATRRWPSFAAAPLLPLLLVFLLGLLLAAGGLLFDLPVGNIVAAVCLALAIPVGFLMAFLLIGWVGGVHLMYPSLAAEGTDAFDALSRSYSYVLARPWRFVFYTLLALGYGVITYLFVGVFIFLGLYLVQNAAATWAGQVDSIFPRPEFGKIDHALPELAPGTTAQIAAAIVRVWLLLSLGLIAAYAVSFYFTAFSNIYLILRRYCDGTDMSEVHLDVPPSDPAAQVDKLEPAPPAPRSGSPRPAASPSGDPPGGSDLDRQADDR